MTKHEDLIKTLFDSNSSIFALKKALSDHTDNPDKIDAGHLLDIETALKMIASVQLDTIHELDDLLTKRGDRS